MNFDYKLDKEIYNVEVIRKNNKNTYIKVKDDLTIYVTTNYLTSKFTIKRILNSNKEFLREMLKKTKEKQKKENEFYYLGKKYDIIKVPFDKVEMEDNKIFTKDDKQLDKWLKNQMKEIFKQRLDYNYDLFEENIPYPILKTRAMKTRWGVCNKRDNSVTLNTKLIRYDINIIDYVIIHELSHFVHFDHSRNFWKTVEKYQKNYKKNVKVLKE